MLRYRFDFLGSDGGAFATHEIDYDCDKDAIEAAHRINGSPTIGCCFQVWHGDRLVHWYYNTEAVYSDPESVRIHPLRAESRRGS
jgi:hypothetical protein